MARKIKAKTRITRKLINEYKDTIKKDEPASEGVEFKYSRLSMTHAFNWYNENSDVKHMRKYVERYAKKFCDDETTLIVADKKDNEISMTLCVVAKMILCGCVLSESEHQFITNKLLEFKKYAAPIDTPKVDIPKETENALLADTEEVLDTFFKSNYKASPVDYFKILTERESKPQDVRQILAFYEPLLDEVQKHREDLTTRQKNSYTRFIDKILQDSKLFLTNTRKEHKLRKPRKKKIKPVDQVVSKVQFKEKDADLKLTSVPPASIVGSTGVWFFNSRYKKLTYLEASKGETLSVKGTTIVGFDDTKSLTKTIRKPEKALADLINNSSKVMLKQFLALKTKAITAKGRLNKDVLLLKVIK